MRFRELQWPHLCPYVKKVRTSRCWIFLSFSDSWFLSAWTSGVAVTGCCLGSRVLITCAHKRTFIRQFTRFPAVPSGAIKSFICTPPRPLDKLWCVKLAEFPVKLCYFRATYWRTTCSVSWTDRSRLIHVAFVSLLHLLHVLILLPQDLLQFIYLLCHWEGEKLKKINK